jgi:hypothetical protein
MSKATLLLLGLSLLFMRDAGAQKGATFPTLEGEVLSGEAIVLPGERRSKPLLVGMAYSKKAETDLKTWYNPMFNTFVLKRGIMDHLYDVDLYMIPMFTGMKQAAYETSKKKLQEDNRNDLFPHIVFYRGSISPFDKVLNMTDKAKPYFFVINSSGTVVYATNGPYTSKKQEQIENALDALLD